jgi:hypothetical protein
MLLTITAVAILAVGVGAIAAVILLSPTPIFTTPTSRVSAATRTSIAAIVNDVVALGW